MSSTTHNEHVAHDHVHGEGSATSRSHTGITTTTPTTVTFTDSTRITTTNVNHPPTRSTSTMTMSTVKDVATSRIPHGDHVDYVHNGCRHAAPTASTTTSTDADAY